METSNFLHSEPRHHYKIINKKGILLCHATGCNKMKNLYYCYNGLFCEKHIIILSGIRNRLILAKYSNNIANELYERESEIRFRKIIDPGHIYYYQNINIYKKICN